MDKQEAINGIYEAYQAAQRDKFIEGVECTRERQRALREGKAAERDINYVQAAGIQRTRYRSR